MRNDDVESWAAARVKELLPGLEGDSLTAAVRYSLSLSPDDTDRHWRSLLGSTPQVDSFLKQLGARRRNVSPKQHAQQDPRNPVPSTPPPPRMDTPPIAPARTSSPSKVLRITSSIGTTSRNRKGPGKMTSDLLGSRKSNKPAPPSPMAVAVQENRPMTELEEIDSAIQSLTLDSTSGSSTKKRRFECGCFGTKHDVYPLAPNCLHCGRIHCISEGLGPCFFCGEDLVSESVREDVLRELRHERGIAKTKAANEKVRKVRATGDTRHNRVWAAKVGGQEVVGVRSAPMTPSLSRESDSGGGSGYATPSSALLEAERRRDELLEFDRTFAERTKIIDQQAEFTPHATIHDSFSTAQERAAAVRRLQQMEAEQAAAERARRMRVLDIDFKSGKTSVRTANAEDLIDVPAEGNEFDTQFHDERARGAPIEIVNGFAKPTFVDT